MTAQKVKVFAMALANDYSAAYRVATGRECHVSDLFRVRDGVKAGCPDGTAYLVEGNGRRYLANPETGWLFDAPAPGTYRVLATQ